MGGSVEIDIKDGYPVLINDPTFTEDIKSFATELVKENIIDLPMRTTAEDFRIIHKKYQRVFTDWALRLRANLVIKVHTQGLISKRMH